MIAVTDKVTSFFRACKLEDQSATSPLPETLRMSLEARVEARQDGSLDADRWRSECGIWSTWADTRYRACAHRKELGSNARAIRIGVKDTINVVGFPTRLGLRHHRHYPDSSAAAVRAIDTEFAEIVAKVVTTELNLGVGSGCVNPYVPDVAPAGSSTGSAVSVTANICDISLGTDVLGSIRWPAGNCGAVGLRTTCDRADLHGIFPLSPQMDALGWVTRSAEDLFFLWQLLRLGGQERSAIAPLGRCQVSVVENAFDRGCCHPEMRDALHLACRLLEDAGHHIRSVRLDDLWAQREAAWQLCAREAWDGYRLWQKWMKTELSESTQAALEIGARIDDQSYGRILDRLAACRKDIESRFDAESAEIWLLPLHPTPPRSLRDAVMPKSTIPASDQPDYEQRLGYTPIASFAGLPAITMPIKRSEVSGAPLAIQMLGRPHRETQLIAIAADLERVRGDLRWNPS